MDQNEKIEFDETMLDDEFAGMIRSSLDEAFDAENISVSEDLIAKTLGAIKKLENKDADSNEVNTTIKNDKIVNAQELEQRKKASRKRMWRQIAGVVAAVLVVGVGFITIRGGIYKKNAENTSTNTSYKEDSSEKNYMTNNLTANSTIESFTNMDVSESPSYSAPDDSFSYDSVDNTAAPNEVAGDGYTNEAIVEDEYWNEGLDDEYSNSTSMSDTWGTDAGASKGDVSTDSETTDAYNPGNLISDDEKFFYMMEVIENSLSEGEMTDEIFYGNQLKEYTFKVNVFDENDDITLAEKVILVFSDKVTVGNIINSTEGVDIEYENVYDIINFNELVNELDMMYFK